MYKNIYFIVLYKSLASTKLRGIQIGEALKKYGYTYQMIYYQDHCRIEEKVNTDGNRLRHFVTSNSFYQMIGEIKNSIVMVLKNIFMSVEVLKILKKNNNIIVMDTIDLWYFVFPEKQNKLLGDQFHYYDSTIVHTHIGLLDLLKIYSHIKRCDVIQIHWDPDLKDLEKKDFNKLLIGYQGSVGSMLNEEKQNCLYLNEFKNDIKTNLEHASISEANQNEKVSLENITCHYSIRDSLSWQCRYKSSIKLNTAAATNTNIIISHDPCIGDLLPMDYPYLTSDHQDDVRKTIEHVKETFGGPVWKYGLEIMQKVKERTDLDVIILDYVRLFDQLISLRVN